MKKALIVHGTDGKPEDNWFPWLKTALEKQGYQVWVPQLPLANKPNIARYNEYILANTDFVIDKYTVLIGHSSGAVAILGLLQELSPEIQVKASYLVGSFKDDLGWDALTELFNQPFDFAKIKNKSRLWYFVHSDNDPYCPLDHARYLHSQIGGDLLVLPGQKHFSVGTAGEAYRQFPYLYHLIVGDLMTAQLVKELYSDLKAQGIKIWIDGGWGVDVLLEEQTRPHGDLDIAIKKKDEPMLRNYLTSQGYTQILRSDTTDYNYVLGDSEGRFVDVHVIELDDKGNGIYGPKENGVMYPAEALTGVGEILGTPVQCISPEWLIKFHTGYELRESDYHDVLALCKKFEIPVPEEYKGDME